LDQIHTRAAGGSVSAHFEVDEEKAHRRRFRPRAGNGEMAALGESRPVRADAGRSCEAVNQAAAEADIVEAKAA
jgi:uncharacterized protein YegP (UPF0339 family)